MLTTQKAHENKGIFFHFTYKERYLNIHYHCSMVYLPRYIQVNAAISTQREIGGISQCEKMHINNRFIISNYLQIWLSG